MIKQNQTIEVKGQQITVSYFSGVWEALYNPNFKPLEFDGFKIINYGEFATTKFEL